MAIRNIRIMGDPILEKVCKEVKEVTPRIKELIEDMLETMYDANGVGLAAPQVGVLKRIVVIDVTGEDPIVLINPPYPGNQRRADRGRRLPEPARKKRNGNPSQLCESKGL